MEEEEEEEEEKEKEKEEEEEEKENEEGQVDPGGNYYWRPASSSYDATQQNAYP